MSAVNDGGPAFPMQDQHAIHAWAQAKIEILGLATTAERDAAYIQARAEAVGGMSLRDYFAAKAMHGLMTMDGVKVGEEGMQIPKHADIVAEIAYQMAGAMLKARAK